MGNIDTVRDFIKEAAIEFGAKPDQEYNKPYIERNNTSQEALKDNGGYFGFIHPEEEVSGPFHDFSYTIFPSQSTEPWLICLGIGSSGFKNDYELATYPGLRRLFSNLVDDKGFCKSNFSDIETSLPRTITGNDNLNHLKKTLKTYAKVLPVCQIVEDPLSDHGKSVIKGFLAGYAKLRDWPTNNTHRKAIADSLQPFMDKNNKDDQEVVKNLLSERKYIVLQGPPGTGKTRLAKEIASNLKAKTFFTQFHAETSYSDFIYGLRPEINNSNLSYTENIGIFVESLRYASEHQDTKVILIIDEINRANLSNILGPIFYLFEHKMDIHNTDIEVAPGFVINKIPDNFHVIATMNTADRSLAVVDFALRRRFAWYSLKPRPIKDNTFYKDDYFALEEIFNWYANSLEMQLQPGQGYFIANSEQEMRNRLEYELLPLIREYLMEGLLMNAKEEFNNFFTQRIERGLFE